MYEDDIKKEKEVVEGKYSFSTTIFFEHELRRQCVRILCKLNQVGYEGTLNITIFWLRVLNNA